MPVKTSRFLEQEGTVSGVAPAASILGIQDHKWGWVSTHPAPNMLDPMIGTIQCT